VFSSTRDIASQPDVFVATLNENVPPVNILKLDGFQSPQEWLLDDVILFESGVNGANTNLWQLGPSLDAPVRPYIEADADLDDIAVSPDGAWAAYQSDETGIEEIYVDNYPDPSRSVRVTEGGGQYPQWSPDGGVLYYWSEENLTVDSLYAAQVRTNPAFSVVSQEVILEGNYWIEDWDLHPDGDRFVVSRPVPPVRRSGESDEVRFVVVLNFFEELKQRVGNGND
jgi:hypothetical protein